MDGPSWEILHCFQFWHSDTVIIENSGIIFSLHLQPSHPPVCYSLPHQVSTDTLFWCFLRQLPWHRGSCWRGYLTQQEGHVLHCVDWEGRMELRFSPKASQKWVSVQEQEVPSNTNTHCAWYEVESHSPGVVPLEWWRKPECLDIDFTLSPLPCALPEKPSAFISCRCAPGSYLLCGWALVLTAGQMHLASCFACTA